MEKTKIKKIVSKLLHDGESLGDIQKIIETDYQESMTFLELRLLASEIENIDWTQNEEPDPEPEPEKEKEKHADDNKNEGKTVIEINKLTRPGVAMHGSVKFASGASAEWVLDQMGRLGLEKPEGTATPEDLKEFQQELQKSLDA